MVRRLNGLCELPSDPKSKLLRILKQQGVVSALFKGRLALRRDSPWLKQCADTQEALEAEAERDMSGLGRSISTMSFNSGEREHLSHQFSGNVASMGGSSPHLGRTGAISHQIHCQSPSVSSSHLERTGDVVLLTGVEKSDYQRITRALDFCTSSATILPSRAAAAPISAPQVICSAACTELRYISHKF